MGYNVIKNWGMVSHVRQRVFRVGVGVHARSGVERLLGKTQLRSWFEGNNLRPLPETMDMDMSQKRHFDFSALSSTCC